MNSSLNHIYRVIWCKVRLAWVVVGETVSGHGKVQSDARRSQRQGDAGAQGLAALLRSLMGPDPFREAASAQTLQRWMGPLAGRVAGLDLRLTALAAALLAGAALAAPPVQQLPTGGQVSAGQASVAQSGSVMTITQSSPRAAINWNTFDVGSQARVNFVQPDSQSVALNRVLSSNPSQIFGQINANGQIYLMNPSGVYFAPGAQVNVGGIVATTHQMSDADFMAGKTTFARQGATGSVVNEGDLQARLGGYIAMLAPEVRNSGVVVAQAGAVAMAAGEQITLNFGATSRLESLTVTASQIDSLVENRLAVRAPNGLIILSAQATNRLAASVVNSGILAAQGVSEVGGRIWLDGGSVRHSGQIQVNSDTAQGGQVQITGDSLRLDAGSHIDARGALGGGQVLVGGDWQGGQGVYQATTTTLAEGASIDASATQSGHGGKVVLWSDVRQQQSLTQVDGTIAAAGAGGGQGGAVETSGGQLGVGAHAQVSAGQGGQWLLDPADVWIYDGGATGYSNLSGVYTPTSGTAAVGVNNGTLSSALSSGTSITITTTNAGTSANGSGTIYVQKPVSWTGAANLTLVADLDIQVLANITASGSGGLALKAKRDIVQNTATTVQTQGGTVIFWSDTDADGAGVVALIAGSAASYASVLTNGGGIWIGGGATGGSWTPYAGAAALAVGQGASSGYGTFIRGIELGAYARLNAGTGNLWLNGKSTASAANSYGVALLAQSTLLGKNIHIEGVGANGTGGNFHYDGVMLERASITASGDLNILGTGNGRDSTGGNAMGILLSASTLTSTGGNITLTGVGGTSTGSYNYGVWVYGGSTVSTGAGNITISAQGGTTSGSYGMTLDGGSIYTGSGHLSITANSPASIGFLMYGSAANTRQLGAAGQTGNISIVTNDTYWHATGTNQILGSGQFSLTPMSASLSFTAAQEPTYLQFASTLTGVTIGNSVNTAHLTIGSNMAVAGPVNLYGGNLTINANLSTSNATTGDINLVSTTGNISQTGSIALANNRVLSVTSLGNDSLAGVISGTGVQLIKLGTGTLTLSGVNTYSGATTVSGGTLDVTGSLGDSTAVTVASGASYNVSATDTVGSVAGAGTVNLASAQTITVGGDNSSTTFSGVLAGAGGFSKAGTGTLTLSGVNTYSGATTVSGGVLDVTSSLSDSTAVTVASGASYNVSATDTVGSVAGAGTVNLASTKTLTVGGDNSSTTFSGVLAGAGGFSKAGTGTLTLSGANTYSGATTVSGGVLDVTGSLADTTAVTVASGASYNVSATDTVGSVAGAGTVNLASAQTITVGGDNSSTTFSGVLAGAGGFSKAGTGTLTLTGSNTYTGRTTISVGTLQLGNAGTAGSIASTSDIVNNAVLSVSRSDNLSMAAPISGTGQLTQAGNSTLTLTGLATYSGASTVTAASGSLVFSNNARPLTSGFLGNGSVTIAPAGAAFSAVINTNSYTYANTLGGLTVGNASSATNANITVGTAINISGPISLYGSNVSLAANLTTSRAGAGIVVDASNSIAQSLAVVVQSNGGDIAYVAEGVNSPSTVISLNGTINAQGGNISLQASATGTLTQRGIVSNQVNGTNILTTGSGSISLSADLQNVTRTSTVWALDIRSALIKTQSGNLTLEGIGGRAAGSTGGNSRGIYIEPGTRLLSASGPIRLKDTKPGTFTGTYEGAYFLVGFIGADGANVSASSSNVVIQADKITAYGTSNISTSGAVTIESVGSSFTAPFSLVNMTLASTISQLTLGKSGNTADITIGQNASVAGPVTVYGGNITVSGNLTTTNTSTGHVSFFANVGGVSGSSNLTLASGRDLTITQTGASTYSGVISGANVTLSKAGAGTLTLGGAHTFSGSTTVSSGVLAVTGSLADATTVTVASGASYNVSASDAVASIGGTGTVNLASAQILTLGGDNSTSTFSGALAGTGAFTKVGTGTLTLSGANTYTGATTVSAGVLSVTGSLADSTAVTVASGASYNVSVSDTVGSIAGAGTVNLASTQTLTVGGDNTSTTFSGILTGAGDLTKGGTGTLTLTGSNSHGNTTISAGTLQVGAGGATGSLGSGAVVNDGALVFNRDATASLTVTNAISGNGSLTQMGTGTLILGGTNTYSGATTVSAGVLDVTGSLGDSTAVTVASGASYNVSVTDTVASIAGAGTVNLASGQTLTVGGDNTSITFSGALAGAGAFAKTGTGTLTLSGANTYSGATTVSAGVLDVTGSLGDSTAVTVASGASYNVSATDAVASLAGTGTINLASAQTITLGGDNSSTTFAGALAGSGGLAKAGTGTLTLSGLNTYTGATQVSGALVFTNAVSPSTSGFTGNGAVTLQAVGGTFSTGTYSFSNTLTGLTIGNVSGTGNANITVNSSLAIAGDISLYGADVAINAALSSSVVGGVVKLQAGTGGAVTQSAAITASKLALLGGDVTLNDAANNVQTLAASGVSGLSYRNLGALTVGTVNPTGIQATGLVNISTETGDLVIAQNITTTSTVAFGVGAISLNAGRSVATGTGTGGNILVSGAPSVTAGTGALITLYSGNVSGSTGLTAWVGAGSGRFRYNSNATITNFNTTSAPLLTGTYAIYREQPLLTLSVGNATAIYGSSVTSSVGVTGYVNGDTAGQAISGNPQVTVGGTMSASGQPNVGTHDLSAAVVSAIGYGSASANGTLTVTPANLTVSVNNSDKFVTQTDPTGYNGVTYAGLVAGETSAGLLSASELTTGTLSRSSPTTQLAGNYTLSAAGWSASNYNISYTSGDFTIIPAEQLRVRVTNQAVGYGSAVALTPVDVQYFLSANSTLVTLSQVSQSGNTYTYSDGAGGSATFTLVPASASSSTGQYLHVGSYQVTGSQFSQVGSNFNGTPVYSGALTVQAAAVTATASNVSKVYDGNNTMGGVSLGLSGLKSNDVLAVQGVGAFSQINAGSNLSYSVTGLTLSGADAANYYLSSSTLSGSHGEITRRAVTLTSEAVTKVYDGNANATVANLSHYSAMLGISGDTVTGLDLRFADKNVGSGKTLTASNASIADGNGGNNYLVSYAANTTSAISRLNSVTWVGGATGDWFDPANWAGGAVPDLSNVAHVVIPTGVTVTFDNTITPPATLGTVNIDSLRSGSGSLVQTQGVLAVGAGGVQLSNLTLSGGSFSSEGLVSTANWLQSGGIATLQGDLTVSGQYTQTSGTTQVGESMTTGRLTMSGGTLAVTRRLTAAAHQITGGVLTAENAADFMPVSPTSQPTEPDYKDTMVAGGTRVAVGLPDVRRNEGIPVLPPLIKAVTGTGRVAQKVIQDEARVHIVDLDLNDDD